MIRNKKLLIIWLIMFLVGLYMAFVYHKAGNTRAVQAESTTAVYTEPSKEYESLGRFTVTAYCHCTKCCGKSDGITASGTKATAGHTIAADTSIFPFGTELYILGEKYIVEDRGGAIKGNCIDIYFNNHSEAVAFGRQYLEVLREKGAV